MTIKRKLSDEFRKNFSQSMYGSEVVYVRGTGASAKRLQSFRQEWNSLFSAVKPDCKKDFSVKF